MSLPNEQLGRDLRLSGGWNAGETDIQVKHGDLATVDDLDNVRQALFLRLNTPLGDLWAHPNYGNAAWDIIGEGIEEGMLARVLTAITECVKAEPRVELISISQTEYPEERTVSHTITYKVLNDTRTDNLVFTIDLERVMNSV